MDRRGLLGAFALLGTGLAGCVGAPRADGGGEPRITDRTLSDTGRCADPESATVEASAERIRIDGCITGPNGCSVARLGSATVDDEGETVTVVVTTETDAPPGTACTQALVPRGYEATVGLAGAPPATVRVVHDAAGGREQVAEVTVDS
jgi:hypothetical protein